MLQEKIQIEKADLFIGGEWRAASDNTRFAVTDPATGEIIAQVANGTVDDARAAIDVAAKAQPEWAAASPRHRAEILRRAYELLIAQEDRFARLITRENGKALRDSRGELRYAAEFFRWYAEEAVRNLGSVL